MVMGQRIKIHSAGESAFEETRDVDSPDLRIATLRANTRPSQIGILRDRLVSTFEEFGINSDIKPQSCMAIEEALANAIYHGNLGLDSDLKEDGSSKFGELAKERSEMAPWKDRSVSIVELATPFGVWITIADEGEGFNVARALEKTVDPEALLASGRGLIMMKAFSDDLVFNSNGNEVTLVFYNKLNQDIKELLKHRAESRGSRCGNSVI